MHKLSTTNNHHIESEKRLGLILSFIHHIKHFAIRTEQIIEKFHSLAKVANPQQSLQLHKLAKLGLVDIMNIIERMELLCKPSINSNLDFETCDIKEAIRSNTSIAYTNASKSNPVILELESIEERIFVKINKSIFSILINNLLTNAIDYSPPNSTIKLILDMQNATCIIRVINEVDDFKKEIESQIYSILASPNNTSSNQKIRGVGLSVSRLIAELHGGGLNFSKTETEDRRTTVCFALLLPTASVTN